MVFPTDWTVNKENASTLTVNDTVTEINGVSSLNTRIVDAGFITERLSLQNNTYTNGITEGRIRSKMRIDTMTTDGRGRVGFGCMQSAGTIFNGVDQGYGVVVSGTTGLGTPAVDIIKWTAGLPSSPVILATTAVPTLLLGQTFVFQMDWISDFPLLGGTLLRGYIGINTTDFNNLVEVATHTDLFSPILASNTEGIIHASFGVSNPPDFDVKHDDLSIFTLT